MRSGVAIASLVLALPASAQAATAVSVFPIPGSRAASPQTQIAFRGIPAAQLGAVTVIGSRTGIHSGRIVSDSDGLGGSFLPAAPFRPGESVRVTTSLNIVRGQAGSFSFQVVTPAGGLPFRKFVGAPRVPGDIYRFQSRPDLVPVPVTITTRTARTAPGDIFVAPQAGPLQNGPMILDPAGRLLWFLPMPRDTTVTDFRVQHYLGQPVLTWWQGNQSVGTGRGIDVIMNTSYQQIATVRAANGLSADLHEFEISPRNTALITAYYPVYWDASSISGGSKRAIVLDSVVQEIDIPTGLVLFQWDSLDHVPLSDNIDPHPKSGGGPFDYFHVNSIDQDSDGNLIVSSRSTWTVFKLDHSTGAVIWRLGGKHSSFKLGPGTGTVGQHDARVYPNGLITMFDNGGGPPRVHSQSRGVIDRLDTTHMTVTLLRQIEHSPPLPANFEGGIQALPDGGWFLGWGQQPYFSEYDSRGRLQFDGHFVDANSTYRAYRLPWSATPRTLPKVAAVKSTRSTLVYMTWNGATAVASWRVLGGPSPTSLTPMGSRAKHGFETELRVPGVQAFVAVQALDLSGHVLKTSIPVASH